MKFYSTHLLFVTLFGLLLSGCVSPESRIKHNPEAFNRLSPSAQDLVKKGRVDVGFDKESVKLALGDPDRIYLRTDESGSSEVWVYSNFEGADGAMLYRGYYHRFYNDPFLPYYLNYGGRQEYERVRITFQKDKVVSSEQISK